MSKEKVYLVGDTHGNYNGVFKKLVKSIGENDKIIVLGDFGFIFHTIDPDIPETFNGYLQEQKTLNQISEDCAGMVLFIDGNHENHKRLSLLTHAKMFGGVVGMVRPNIAHLRRNQRLTIANKSFVVMGGASSHDKEWRREHKEMKGWDVLWEKEEVWSPAEKKKNIAMWSEIGGEKIDFVLSHTPPQRVIRIMFGAFGALPCPVSDELNLVIENEVHNIGAWYHGHLHLDQSTDCCGYQFHCLYETEKLIIGDEYD